MAKALGERQEPGLLYKFYLEIEGVVVAEFTDLSGLSAEREIKQYAEGGVNDYVHLLPGRVKYPNLVLKRGQTYSHDLWEWFQDGIYDGKVARKNLSIILGDASGLRVKQWDVTGAYPVKYTSSDLKTDTNEFSFETMELAHHGITLNPQVKSPM